MGLIGGRMPLTEEEIALARGGAAPAAQAPSTSWMQALANGLYGMTPEQMQSTTPQGVDVRRQALDAGLLQAALALSQPGGLRNNWGSAILSGVVGTQEAAREGQAQMVELARRQRYRKVLAQQLELETDPDRRLRLEHMIADPDQGYLNPIRDPQRPAPVPRWRPNAAGDEKADFVYDYGPNGEITRTQVGPWSKVPKTSTAADKNAEEEKREILEARKRVAEWKTGKNRVGNVPLRNLNLPIGTLEQRTIAKAQQSYYDEDEASYGEAQRQLFEGIEQPNEAEAGGWNWKFWEDEEEGLTRDYGR